MQAMAIEEEHEPMPGAVSMVSRLLERVAEANDKNRRVVSDRRRRRSVSSFHGVTRPGISIDGYLRRIFKYANCSPSCFVVAYVYLDRFTLSNPSIPIDSFNVHRLLVTSVMLSAKFMDDLYYNNAYYAKVGGISRAEINVLELDFLFGLRFQLNVTPHTFTTYCSYLHKEFLLHSPNPLKLHHCFNEDESTSQQKDLAF